ncbi:alpha-1,2-fucosyltransferase [Yersinia enterocolitica]|uniref:alpha-1,2-fucosyltransferase n=1 Tax=Yersinia enterocolitica TaxID=630 RepID=UPI0005DEACDA|nr:alpha-1,2-fucosyltransferase [Yersinia enterocolitica]CNJ89213.1 putative glycosyl transferase [Yersinia enterocolitica]CRY09024.1 putative glycosyl transferase [Yersinia enterocolitica]HDL6511779.1 alpha-1,2-fucosyltransferase [Yersinia enterocolitica]HDL7837780.1 alpha-1,2-fucosyltransferase [Yersinia enterocolitica]HDL8487837.1 alpha-1,2-fucosyltransferase [Yersinia enterocolitica]
MSVNVLVQGGLGNQLFQVAWAYYLKDKLKFDVNLNVHLFYQQKQHSAVSFFSLLGELETIPISEERILTFNDDLLSKIIRFSLRKMKINHVPNILIYDYDALSSLDDCLKIPMPNYHYGYFQFPDAALYSSDFLRVSITNKHGKLMGDIGNNISDHVGIHIRRGDFVASSNKLHVASGIEYISNAIEKFPGRRFMVFSDDIDWCKKHLPKISSIDYFSGKSAIEDFIGLMCCQDYILSGSTFSWWAAILNGNKSTKVIIPNSDAQFMSEQSNKKIGWNYERV